MKSWAILKVAIHALGRNKLRSALTMLGIIIGVGAVIIMVSVGQGAQVMVQDQIKNIGTNVLFVWPGSISSGGVHLGAGAAQTLTDADVQAIQREIPVVAAASPIVRTSSQIVVGDQNWFTQIQGTNQYFPVIRAWPVLDGAFFEASQVRETARVIVLGQTVAQNLFPGNEPVGQMVRVGNLPFRVVGVLAPKGQSLMGQDQDDTAVVPFTTVQKELIGQRILSINAIMISCVSAKASDVAEKQIVSLLRQRHKLAAGQSDDFQVRNMTDIAQTADQTGRVMTLLLGSIAAISLIVGGIGIMNIMLVSVTERTREVGIRMAIGARPSYIRMQFLAESVALSLMGGVIGVVVGAGLSSGLSRVLGWPTLVSALSVVASFGFSSMIGIFFGYYPAHKAASLDPIDALRYE